MLGPQEVSHPQLPGLPSSISPSVPFISLEPGLPQPQHPNLVWGSQATGKSQEFLHLGVCLCNSEAGGLGMTCLPEFTSLILQKTL